MSVHPPLPIAPAFGLTQVDLQPGSPYLTAQLTVSPEGVINHPVHGTARVTQATYPPVDQTSTVTGSVEVRIDEPIEPTPVTLSFTGTDPTSGRENLVANGWQLEESGVRPETASSGLVFLGGYRYLVGDTWKTYDNGRFEVTPTVAAETADR